MPTFCHSCGAPLEMPEFKGKHENYCKYCMGDDGILASAAGSARAC